MKPAYLDKSSGLFLPNCAKYYVQTPKQKKSLISQGFSAPIANNTNPNFPIPKPWSWVLISLYFKETKNTTTSNK
jgi:hypothetical protein